MPTKTEKSKVLHSSNVLTTKKKPVAKIIDGNVQLYVLSHIRDNFQGVTEIVFDYLPKPSRVNIMKELFQDIHIDSVMTFLRQINLLNKI